ncbi:MAG TPA: AMIN domain-containing protein, partial [Nitrospiraceae bacterium]
MKPMLKSNHAASVLGLAGAIGLLTLTPVGAQSSASSEDTETKRVLAIEKVTHVADLPAQTLTSIDFQREPNAITIVLSGDGKLSHEAKRIDDRRLVVDIPQVASALQKSSLRVRHPLLTKVRLGHHADKVRVVMDLAPHAAYSIEPQGAQLRVKLSEESIAPTLSAVDEMINQVSEGQREPDRGVTGMRQQRAVLAVQRTPVKFHVRPVQMMNEGTITDKGTVPKEDMVLGETRYFGRRISLDFQQADISNVLRLIAEVSGFNIVVGEGVKSKVTMKLVSVPWDQALDMILKMNGLGKIKQGNILWVDTLANIAKQEDEE